MLGVPRGYHASLGRFISLFAQIELTLFLAMTRTAGINLTMAQAIFTDARIANARDTINRIRAAHGVPEDETLSRAFLQLGEIGRMRNNLVHYGLTREATSNSYVVTNAFFVPPHKKPQRDPVSVAILEAMILDLLTIQTAINNRGFERSEIPKDAIARFRAAARSPWRYKPHAPSQPEKSTRRRRRERPRQPPP
jgi:hypothetical protein